MQADDTSTPRRPAAARPLKDLLDWAWIPITIFVACRGISLLVTVSALHAQPAVNPSTSARDMFIFAPLPESPGLREGLMNWDGQWYRSIAEAGYPGELPTEGGRVAPNSWAFFPLFPFLVRLIMTITSLPFSVAAPALSLACSLAASILIFHMLDVSGGRYLAVVTTLALHTFPTSAVFQLAYSEGLALLLVACAMWAMRHRCLGALIIIGVALSLTRPVGLALAFTLVLVLMSSNATSRSLRAPRVHTAAAFLVLIASTALWPAIVWLTTGVAGAFIQTQAAWSGNVGELGLLGNWLLGPALQGEWALFAFTASVIALLIVVTLRPSAGLWGDEWRAWALAYPVYILMATRPTTSFYRFILLAVVPLWPIPDTWEGAATRMVKGLKVVAPALLLLGYAYLQWRWITDIYVIREGPRLFP